MAEAQKPAAPKAEVAKSTKAKYTVVSGKHQNKDGSFARMGEVVELDPAVAKSFPNKFAPVMIAAPVEQAEQTEETKEA